jgi:dihydroflavonol-4-reductase
MNEKYLITGAAGHLGSAVVRELLEDGVRDIRVLVVPGDKAALKLPDGIEITTGDLLDDASLDSFFDAPEGTELIVIHCAGIVSTSMHFSKRLYDVNVGGTKNIVRKSLEKNVRKFVYVSSVHAIPTLPKGLLMTEVEDFDPARVVGPYAKTKAEATAFVRDAVKAGLNATIVYPCGILGPYDNALSNNITDLIIRYCRGKMPIGLTSRFDFVDVRDVARGVIAAARFGRRGEGYILGNRQVSVKEMFDLFHRETGHRRTRFFAPMWLAKAGLPFAALYSRLRKQRPLFCSYSLHTLGGNSLYSHVKAARELGYSPRPFQETIRDTIAWLKNDGIIK